MQPGPFPFEESTMIPARFWIPVLAALLLASSIHAVAQSSGQTVDLGGEIKIVRGSFPPHSIRVTLETRGLPVGAMYTDDEGKFLFRALVPNMYYVVINDPEYEPVRERIEIRELSGNSSLMQITLTPRESAKQQPRKDNTSGGSSFLVDKSEYEKHYPKNAVKEFDKGNKAAQSNSADEAIRHFKRAVELAPDFYAARNNLGLMLLGARNFSDAEQQFQEVVRLNPSDSQAYFNLGNTYLLTKRFYEAQAEILDGLKRQPESAFGEFLLGTVYSRTGNAAQAEQKLEHVLTIDPTMSRAHLELANLFLQQKNNPAAISELKAFLKASPADAFAPQVRVLLNRITSQTQ
jgi:tetratricopeptide (TPR) repeat protein